MKGLVTDKNKDLNKRAFDFAVKVIQFLKSIKYSKENDVVKYQLAKASTSIGANYEEAQGACSRNDFKYKIGICFRESKESNYWLRIIKAAQIFNNKELDCLIQESSELKNIFASLLSKLRVIARRAEGPTKQSPMEIEIASLAYGSLAMTI